MAQKRESEVLKEDFDDVIVSNTLEAEMAGDVELSEIEGFDDGADLDGIEPELEAKPAVAKKTAKKATKTAKTKTKSQSELQIEDEKSSPKKGKRKGDYHSVIASHP